MRPWARGLVGLALATAGMGGTGCIRHITPNYNKTRAYEPGLYASPDAARTPGSLWSEGAHNLFEDARARRVGDLVTVVVDERSDAARDSGTSTQRRSELQLGVTGLLGAMQSLAAKNPGLDPSALLAAASQNDFNGSGNTSRSGKLTATLPVRIKTALPNGDFYVEGNKVLLLNEEESLLYISGVIRPIDIEPDNSVPSSKVADAQLEYTGRGTLADNEHQGWLGRALKWMWPF